MDAPEPTDCICGHTGRPCTTYEAFRDAVRHQFERTPLEGGHIHPAEATLLHEFQADRGVAIERIVRLYREWETRHPGYAADLVVCVGHVARQFVGPWFFELAAAALACPSSELRDNAVNALEHVRGPDALAVLRAAVPGMTGAPNWLRHYAAKVLVEFEDEQAEGDGA